MRTNSELSLLASQSNEKHFKLVEKADADLKDKDDEHLQKDAEEEQPILREYDGFSLNETTLQVKMSNRLSLSAFAKASHRLRSMALVSGHLF